MDRELRSGKEINEDTVPHHGDTGRVSTEEMESGGIPPLAKRPRPDDVTADSTGEIEEDTGGKVADGKESDQTPRVEVNITPETGYGCACPICGFVAKTPTALKIHSKRKHTGRGKTRAVSSAEVLVEIDGSTTGATAPTLNYKTGGDTEEKVSSSERQQDATESQSQGTEPGGSEGEGTTIIAQDEIAEKQGTGRDTFDMKVTPIAAEEEQEKTPGKKIRRHTKEMNYFCEFCLYACVAKCDYEKHCLSNKHNKRTRASKRALGARFQLQCESCEFRVSNSALLESHARLKHHGEHRFLCNVCHYYTATSEWMDTHVSSESHQRVAEEKNTGSSFEECVEKVSRDSIGDDMLTDDVAVGVTGHDGELQPDVNEEAVEAAKVVLENMEEHMDEKSPPKRRRGRPKGPAATTCEHCGLLASNSTNLNVHIRRKHSRQYSFTCRLCSYNCVTKGDMDRHCVTKKHLKRVEDASSDGQVDLDTSVQVVRSKGEEGATDKTGELSQDGVKAQVSSPKKSKYDLVNSCSHCSFVAHSIPSLDLHVKRRHTRDFEFVCLACSYYAVTRREMSRHAATDKHKQKSEVYLENLESFVVEDLAQPEEESMDLGNRADPDADNNAHSEDPSPSENTEIQVAGEASGGGSEQTSNEAPGTIEPQEAPAEITITPPEEGQKEGAEPEAEPELFCSDDDVEMADEKPDISSPEKQLTRALPFDACIIPLKSLTEAELALHEERMAHSVEGHSGLAVSGLAGAGSFQKIKRTKPVGSSGLSKGLTPNPRIRCEDCGFVADGMSGLNVHISMKHPSKEKHFHCMLCGKSFYTESNLHQHLTSAAHLRNEQASIEELPEGGATFKCVKCTDPFETEQELFVHIKEKHEELLREVNKYVLEDTEQINREREENQGSVCKHCGKVCKSSNSMAFLAHIRTHTGSKPFKCKICNFATAQLGDARNHVKRHLGMREYKCHICG
ncbi:unnamed protein product [Oncorhynchus mykiss]|uniref:C2H2-type domain-containing protein n=1 Tax=Oncorhynchus mykiss TaxID=8022 RepID=A0A060XU28_ONCMY|nr:unnamed protein product [Oncorhynchus mykiss]